MSGAAVAQNIGPSTTTEPYVLPTRAGVKTTSILTVGDKIGGYRMVGLPDGMGLFNEKVPGGANFNLLLNHEIGREKGVVRSHGSAGAFVSRWTLEKGTLKVIAGRDHIKSPNDIFTWKNGGYSAATTAMDRLCSADMAGEWAYFFNGKGTKSRIMLSGEETTPPFAADHDRVFAHVATGANKDQTFELPRLGKIAFENAIASPYGQNKTVVMLTDDAGRETNVTTDTVCKTLGQTGCTEAPSELYVYVGTKQNAGNDVQRAGLTNGNFFGIRVKVNGSVVAGENKDFVFAAAAPAVTSGRFETVNFGDVTNKTGVQIQDEAITKQVTQFIRIEDGAWDPRAGRQNDFYFVTTGRISSDSSKWRPSRLWRLRFDNVTKPEAGGSIEMLLSSQFYADAGATPDADPRFQMFDNLTIDGLGRIILQEDTGGNDRLGRVYVYGIDSRKLVQVAAHNPKFFGVQGGKGPNFLTNDEENSGIIDASATLGKGWFVLVGQSHLASADPALVEGGQLIGMYIDPAIGR